MEVQSSIYVGHGSPTNAIVESRYRRELRAFAEKNPRPDAIICVSAHWQQRTPITITSSKKPPLIYDFYGFPDELYRLRYDCPGDPKLAERARVMFAQGGVDALLDPSRGLDHGSWVPLLLMYPDADIPVLQVSMPVPRHPEDMYNVGRLLAPLREENVLLMASGNIVHNLPYALGRIQRGEVDFGFDVPVEDWAAQCDEWVKTRLDNVDIDALLNSSRLAPHFSMAAPTTEHYDPLYFLMGTMMSGDGVEHFHESFQAGSFSMRCVAFLP